ncbi:hypothetical protein F8M41_017661 [Gigaspora margarita]|uniref:Uncharacterized protein n=1 Tax=Gigaspora margarita TaxID=4874 RepID=A0A8H4ELY5_GIGMA|nr:hypothetical protein F8M41_017661 [Gigaspora margarita]
MKNPKEMTDEELYHALKARKIRLGVAKEVASTYSPSRVVLTTLISPVHAAGQVSINASGSVAHEYTKSNMDDITKEMNQRGLDSKKFDNDPQTEVYISKWVKLWKCVKLVSTIIAIDVSEIRGLIEVVSDLHEAVVDFCDVINDISELCLAIMDSDSYDNVVDGINQASDTVDVLKSGSLIDLTVKSVEGVKNTASSIDLSVFTSKFTLFTNGNLKSEVEAIVDVVDLAEETKDLVIDDKKDSTNLNSTNNTEPKRIIVNLANLSKMLENKISQYPTTKQLFISSKSETLTTDVTKTDNEEMTKVDNEKVVIENINSRIQNITTAAASITIPNIGDQISQYTSQSSDQK